MAEKVDSICQTIFKGSLKVSYETLKEKGADVKPKIAPCKPRINL